MITVSPRVVSQHPNFGLRRTETDSSRYSASGPNFWSKQKSYVEQPDVRYEYKYIILLEGAGGGSGATGGSRPEEESSSACDLSPSTPLYTPTGAARPLSLLSTSVNRLATALGGGGGSGAGGGGR